MMKNITLAKGKDYDEEDDNLVVAIEASGECGAADEGEEGEAAPGRHHHDEDCDHDKDCHHEWDHHHDEDCDHDSDLDAMSAITMKLILTEAW